MPYEQFSLFPNTNPTTRKPEASVDSEIQSAPSEVTTDNTAAASKMQAIASKSTAGKRQKASNKARSKPRAPGASIELLTVEQVALLCTVSRATIWRWVKGANGFPQPLRLASGTTRWRFQDVLNWQATCAVSRLEWGVQ